MLSEFDPCPLHKETDCRERYEEVEISEADGSKTRAWKMRCAITNELWLERFENTPKSLY